MWFLQFYCISSFLFVSLSLSVFQGRSWYEHNHQHHPLDHHPVCVCTSVWLCLSWMPSTIALTLSWQLVERATTVFFFFFFPHFGQTKLFSAPIKVTLRLPSFEYARHRNIKHTRQFDLLTLTTGGHPILMKELNFFPLNIISVIQLQVSFRTCTAFENNANTCSKKEIDLEIFVIELT